jgi:hypothetical protein
MRFYLDEHLSPKIAELARGLGVDVLTTQEAGTLGLPDPEQLRYAAREGRCIVTRDHGDFIRFTYEFMAEGADHAGVLLVPRSLPPTEYARLAAALAGYASAHAEDMPPYAVDWLNAKEDA